MEDTNIELLSYRRVAIQNDLYGSTREKEVKLILFVLQKVISGEMINYLKEFASDMEETDVGDTVLEIKKLTSIFENREIR